MVRQKVTLLFFALAFVWCCQQALKGPEYYDPAALATFFDGSDFVGSGTCRECHADVYKTHVETAHYGTSAYPEDGNLLGRFNPDDNKVLLENAEVELVREGHSHYQVIRPRAGDGPMEKERIDIIIGSGVKGQSHLSWSEDQLFQLQASYYPPADCWINSPGFPSQMLRRPIRDGCLKCHVTFATNKDFSGQGNRYEKDEMVLGVDCERCHRPAGDHVRFHRNNPDLESPHFIMKLDTLSRQQKIDVCAQCHSGPRAGILQGNSFSFLSGETLSEYSRNFHTGVSDAELDVHGNQYGLLSSSACFVNSEMDCGSCHDPHKNERGLRATFVDKCKQCHVSPDAECKADASIQQERKGNCVSCHMPNFPSQTMTVRLDHIGEAPVMVRTHRIAIYPPEKWEKID
ncbi:MAG: hypothetical protein KTR24_14665 [Saprospiraceae bacterium]|nr:hypothetical protein [Saprospiraceae bacterium]